MRGVLHTDGGARGNPGPAGIGVVLVPEAGERQEVARSIGATTNNVAEYQALIAGLELALEAGIDDLEVSVDSELVVAQMQGRWKIKNDRLRALAAKAQALMSRFDKVEIKHVRRHLNSRADKLANQGMDRAEVDSEAGGPRWASLDLEAPLSAEDER